MSVEVIMVIFMFGLYIGLLFTGFPVAFVLGGTGVVTCLIGEMLKGYGVFTGVDIYFLGIVVNRIWGTMSNTGLMSIPLFILMGYALERGGIATQLMTALTKLMRNVHGGLALSVVIIGLVLAASTGVIGASLILLGTLAIKPMLDARYKPELSFGVIAASGCLGILLPPSIMLIVFSDQFQLSVGDLFVAAIMPGLMLSVMYAVFVVGAAWLWPSLAGGGLAPGDTDEVITIRDYFELVSALVPPLALMVAVLGSIFMGVATPTEAAGVGALGALILTALNGRLRWKEIKDIGMATVQTNSFVFAIFLGATCFAVVLRGIGGDDIIGNAALNLDLGPTGMVILILMVVFVLGFFLDWIEVALIVVPIVRPILAALAIDPLWFAILLAICLQTSFITPPMGPALFYIKALAPPNVRLYQLYRGIIPFVILQLIGMFLVLGFPQIATWLPTLAY